ncbi:MAG: hypothetical protein P8N76_08985 [Pirellulaceae bacterium]|nr:hypothetical protein [Pirellulaceae bacterium]
MLTTLDSILTALNVHGTAEQDRQATPLALDWIPQATTEQLTLLFEQIAQLASDQQLNESVLTAVLRALTRANVDERQQPFAALVSPMVRAYQQLPATSPARHLFLSRLAQQGDAESLQAFAELIAVDPPPQPEAIIEAFAPLWQQEKLDYSQLFPRLLDALAHPAAATVVLDFTNFLHAKGRVVEHPAKQRSQQLLELFSRLIERLEGFEEASAQHGVKDLGDAQQVTESIGLAIALCYALSLMKESEAMGRFYRMMDLSHRRLRVEAATALSRLQEKAGTETLVELAAEPSVRLTVLAYAAELGLLDAIDAQHRSQVARAEAELINQLSEPRFYGHPPTACELMDSRQLSWPGFDEAVDCYLFRFTYVLPAGEIANVGIAGPLAHTFAADLTELAIPDAYAAFAGWQAEHEEIRELQIDPTNMQQSVEVEKLRRRMADEAFADIKPQFIGVFFGERCLVASAAWQGASGWIVASGHDHLWVTRGNSTRPIQAELAFSIFKGQRLLRSFNREFEEA